MGSRRVTDEHRVIAAACLTDVPSAFYVKHHPIVAGAIAAAEARGRQEGRAEGVKLAATRAAESPGLPSSSAYEAAREAWGAQDAGEHTKGGE